MNRKFVEILACSAALFVNTCFAGSKVSPGKSDEIEILKNSTLVVVLLEESQKYEDKLNKQHKPALVTAYQNTIKTINDNLQAEAEKYLKVAQSIEYKTMNEIIGMSASTREGYSFLVYDRSTQYGTQGASDFAFDMYAEKEETLKAMCDNYLEYIQFDCADPKYHGEEDYRKLDLIIRKKKTSEMLFVQGLDMIIPTKGSVALCLRGIQNQFNSIVAGDKKLSKAEAKEQALQTVARARTKTLIICKDNLDKNITEAKLSAVFKYKFKLVSREEFDNYILNGDTCCNLLIVYPADKTAGSYKPMVNYQHQVVDAETADVLVIAEPEPSNGGMPVSYAKLTDKNIKDIVKAEDDITK